jgi:hypothetical protein
VLETPPTRRKAFIGAAGARGRRRTGWIRHDQPDEQQLAVIALAALVGGLMGVRKFAFGSGEWPQRVRQTFVDSCVVNAGKAGATPAQAQAYCECVQRETERQLPITEFVREEARMRANGMQLSPAIETITRQCAPNQNQPIGS